VLKIVRRARTTAKAGAAPGAGSVGELQTQLVCHCLRVPYGTVEEAIRRGAQSIADLQRATAACSRCFGCRFELERLLQSQLGADYRAERTISLPHDYSTARIPQPMYMPVLAGFHGRPVDTRLIVFNWEGPREPVGFRVDLMLPSAERVAAWRHDVARSCSAVIDLSRAAVASLLPEGVGVAKLVLDTAEVGSLRPYFQLSTPTSVTSTHEKKGPKDPRRRGPRSYHWIFPVGRSRRPEEAYFFFVNTQLEPMTGQRLVWQSSDGESVTVSLPKVEFEECVCLPLHEHVPGLAEGTKAGSVRLDPAEYKVAGFMLRHDPEGNVWRVQHL
jgi:bacterioferritin-associated ferredoxin